MKIRVLKDLFLFSKGQIIDTTNFSNECLSTFNEMIGHGWIEEVKEETLEDKLHKNCIDVRQTGYIANIATEHFKEKFDKVINDKNITYISYVGDAIKVLREELFK